MVDMAHLEHDREDLLAEATALVERAEFALPGFADILVAGVRVDQALSLYFGSEPVYHFNTHGELRRAYVAGKLYKAVGGRLASLTRVRTASEVQLVRHDLSDAEQQAFLVDMEARLALVRKLLLEQRCEVLRAAPVGLEPLEKLRTWLAALPAHTVVAAQPHVEAL